MCFGVGDVVFMGPFSTFVSCTGFFSNQRYHRRYWPTPLKHTNQITTASCQKTIRVTITTPDGKTSKQQEVVRVIQSDTETVALTWLTAAVAYPEKIVTWHSWNHNWQAHTAGSPTEIAHILQWFIIIKCEHTQGKVTNSESHGKQICHRSTFGYEVMFLRKQDGGIKHLGRHMLYGQTLIYFHVYFSQKKHMSTSFPGFPFRFHFWSPSLLSVLLLLHDILLRISLRISLRICSQPELAIWIRAVFKSRKCQMYYSSKWFQPSGNILVIAPFPKSRSDQ